MYARGFTKFSPLIFRIQMQSGYQIMPDPFKKFALKYTAFRETQRTSAILLKPYHWKCWLAIIFFFLVLTSMISIQSATTCGGYFGSSFALTRISLDQPHGLRMTGNIKSFVFLLVVSIVLSEAYIGIILSFLTILAGVVTPKSLQEL